MDQDFGISRCKLVYTEWKKNKVLMYNTANYTQYPVINHYGKEYKKECIYLCITGASLMAQMVKNPPAMRETWVRSLSWEGPLEEGIVIHSSILAWRIPMDTGA